MVVTANNTAIPTRAAVGRVVLLVEDDPTLRTVIARNLAIRGYLVTVVDSVGGAISAMCARLPDVALLDVHLPDGTGWEVLGWLRAAGHRVPVVICSAAPLSQKRAAEFQPDAVLLKPFPIHSLVEMVAAVGRETAPAAQRSGVS